MTVTWKKTFFTAACFLFSVFAVIPAYGSPIDDINRAAEMYPADSGQALEKLTALYRDGKAGLPLIKSILYEKQFHQLYSDFLDRIPPNRETADEKLQMLLILGKKEGFPAALSNYLRYYPPVSVADKYSDLLYKNGTYLEILHDTRSRELFGIMKDAALRARKTARFDTFLEKEAPAAPGPTNGGIEAADVKKYILESWPFRQRNLGKLLEAYRLDKDPDLSVFRVYFNNLSGDFAGSLAFYPGLYQDSQKKERELRALQIDLPFLFETALFREGRYREAVRDIRRVYFPERNDLPELRYLSFLGLGDMQNAAAEIPSMRNTSKVFFYSGMSALLSNPSNGMEYFEKYIQEPDETQQHLSASLLVYYAMVKKTEKSTAAAELVMNTMLFRETSPVAGLPLSYGYVPGRADSPDQPGGNIGSYVRYRKALDWAQTGKKEESKKALYDLIRNTNGSPVIRSLATYRAREME